MGARVLVIDNYDSFVYNLVQEVGELGADPFVFRNDAIDVEGIRAQRPDAILISPGPGRPEDGGVSLAALDQLAGEIPILGDEDARHASIELTLDDICIAELGAHHVPDGGRGH